MGEKWWKKAQLNRYEKLLLIFGIVGTVVGQLGGMMLAASRADPFEQEVIRIGTVVGSLTTFTVFGFKLLGSVFSREAQEKLLAGQDKMLAGQDKTNALLKETNALLKKILDGGAKGGSGA